MISSRRTRTIPTAIKTALALVVVVGLLWLTDSLVAARAESKMSAGAEATADLATSPNAYIGGFPFLQVFLTGKVPDASVDSLDIDVDGLGIVNARTQLYNIHVDPQDALNGDFIGAPAEMFERTISLDGVAFGQLLNMTDLDISNPYDISPGGGVASEALLTGTPPGFDEPVSALVTLRLEGPMFHMRVRELVDVPQGREDDATEAFTLTRDTRDLPLASQATSVSLSGGSIVFTTQRFNIIVQESDLSPLDTGESAFSQPSDD